jgi:hypothetical protein
MGSVRTEPIYFFLQKRLQKAAQIGLHFRLHFRVL